MRVLVTGGTGFIGRRVVSELLRHKCEVTVLDRHQVVGSEYPWLEISNRQTFAHYRFTADVKDAEAVMEAVGQCDGVIHLAGQLGTQETINKPHGAVEVNVMGSLNVFQAVKACGIPAVYIGVGNYWMHNPYSITKTTAERFAFMFNREFGTRIAVVRGLNVYGPGQKEKPVRKIVPNLVIPALKGEDISIYGDGNQVMDMIYVADIAEILVRALLNDHGVYGRAFQAGCGLNTTVNDLARLVIEMTESTSTVVHIPMRPGETPGAIVKADQREWNLEAIDMPGGPPTSLRDGMSKTIEWYRRYLSLEEEEESTAGLSDPTVACSTTGPGSESLL